MFFKIKYHTGRVPSNGVTSSYFLRFFWFFSKLKMETPPQVLDVFWMSKIMANVVEQFFFTFRPLGTVKKS